MPVPEIDHRRSFVSELKFGAQKPRKRAIGCGFIRIRSKVFPLDGWAGWTRTIGMPQSKCGALPLGYEANLCKTGHNQWWGEKDLNL